MDRTEHLQRMKQRFMNTFQEGSLRGSDWSLKVGEPTEASRAGYMPVGIVKSENHGTADLGDSFYIIYI